MHLRLVHNPELQPAAENVLQNKHWSSVSILSTSYTLRSWRSLCCRKLLQYDGHLKLYIISLPNTQCVLNLSQNSPINLVHPRFVHSEQQPAAETVLEIDRNSVSILSTSYTLARIVKGLMLQKLLQYDEHSKIYCIQCHYIQAFPTLDLSLGAFSKSTFETSAFRVGGGRNYINLETVRSTCEITLWVFCDSLPKF